MPPNYGPCPAKVPLDLSQFPLPTFLDEFLTSFQPHQIVQGTTLLRKPNLADVSKPIPLGHIALDPKHFQVGHSILYQGTKGVISRPSHDATNQVEIFPNGEFPSAPIKDIHFQTTKSQLFSASGVSFSIGNPYGVEQHGRTLIWGAGEQVDRNLSLMGCWIMSGGTPGNFPQLQIKDSEYGEIFRHNNPAEFSTYRLSLLLGLISYKVELEHHSGRTGGGAHAQFHINV